MFNIGSTGDDSQIILTVILDLSDTFLLHSVYSYSE